MQAAQYDVYFSKALQLQKSSKQSRNWPTWCYNKTLAQIRTEAIQLYLAAEGLASTNYQRSVIYWNLASASLAQFQESKQPEWSSRAVVFMVLSLRHGTLCNRSPEWCNKVMDKINDTTTLFFTSSSNRTSDLISFYLRCKCNEAGESIDAQATMDWLIGNTRFKEAITLLDLNAWKDCHTNLEQVLRIVNDALMKPTFVKPKLMELKEDVVFHISLAVSHGLLEQADALFDKHINQDEELNVGMMWNIMDMYSHTMVSTRDGSKEIEAIAASRIGKMYDKIFKNRKKAHTFYCVAYDLGMALQPVDVSGREWFRETLKFRERYQKEIVNDNDAKDSEWKKPFLEKLKPTLDSINNKTPEELLVHIYLHHPPKGSPPPTQPSILISLKLQVRKAIIHYHPDKYRLYDDSKEGFVLHEEICKLLAAHYADLKQKEEQEPKPADNDG